MMRLNHGLILSALLLASVGGCPVANELADDGVLGAGESASLGSPAEVEAVVAAYPEIDEMDNISIDDVVTAASVAEASVEFEDPTNVFVSELVKMSTARRDDPTWNEKHRDVEQTQYSIFGHALTRDEIALFAWRPQNINRTVTAANDAIRETGRRFSNTADGTKANGFQHAYWTILLAKRIDSSWAALFTTAHEEYSRNPAMSKRMDLNNNSVGLYRIFGRNPGKTESEYATLIVRYPTRFVKDSRGFSQDYICYIKR